MKRKILFVYYEPFYSGITRYVSLIIDALSREDFVFAVLCSTNDRRIREELEKRCTEYHCVPGAKYFSVNGAIALMRIGRKFRPDIVHIQNLQSIFWANLPAPLLPNANFIFTPHVINFKNKTVEKIFYSIWRIYSRLTDRIVALSETQKARLVEKGIKKVDAISVVPNSLPEIGADEGITKFPHGLIKPYILSAIRLDDQKNPLLVPQITKAVINSFPDIHFYVAGEGALEGDVRRLINEFGIQNNLTLLGFRKDVPALIRNAELVLSTSCWEGLPYTLLEALALGRPIVASDIPGHRSVIKNGVNGFLVNSVKEYRIGIVRILKDVKLKEAMGIESRELYEREFSFPIFTERVRALYTAHSEK